MVSNQGRGGYQFIKKNRVQTSQATVPLRHYTRIIPYTLNREKGYIQIGIIPNREVIFARAAAAFLLLAVDSRCYCLSTYVQHIQRDLFCTEKYNTYITHGIFCFIVTIINFLYTEGTKKYKLPLKNWIVFLGNITKASLNS